MSVTHNTIEEGCMVCELGTSTANHLHLVQLHDLCLQAFGLSIEGAHEHIEVFIDRTGTARFQAHGRVVVTKETKKRISLTSEQCSA